jgi:hypothetical protein
MGLKGTRWRRWFGAVVLLAATGMLIIGEAFLKGHLGPVGFVVYWLVCFGLTLVAMSVALLDAKILRRRAHEEERALLQSTLKGIEEQAKNRPRPSEGRRLPN